MTSVAFVPWAQTDWGEAGRFATRTPLPINSTGVEQATQWANGLAGRELAAIYAGDEPAAQQTGAVLAERSEVKLRTVQSLQEVDLGLWEGLTPAQIEARFPKLYRRWAEDPASICPPDGESVDEAGQRLDQALRKIAGKHKGGAVAVVVGPISLAIMRSRLEDDSPVHIVGQPVESPIWYRLGDPAHPTQKASATG